MKRKVLYIFLIISIVTLLVGCGSENNSNDNESKKEAKESTKEIVFNQAKEFDNISLTILETSLIGDIIPTNATSFYTHYQAESGKTYLDIIMQIKNVSKQSISIGDEIDGEVKIDENTYSCFVFAEEDNRSDFKSYASIDSLATEYVHMACEISEKTTADQKIEVEFEIEEEKYKFDASSSITKTQKKLEESTIKISNNETQTVEKVAEFYIESSNITKRVNPPKASGYYSYYEADNGKVYIDIAISYKNLNNIDVDCDELIGGAKLIYNNDYEYSGFTIVEEDSRSDFTYANITSISPLTREYIHYLFEIPESIKDDSGSLQFNFRVGDNRYQYQVR